MRLQAHSRYDSDIRKLLKDDRKLGAKVWELLLDIDKYRTDPLQGIGKPEKLKGNYAQFYSRRINQKHRLVYTYEGDAIILVSCYGHYEDR